MIAAANVGTVGQWATVLAVVALGWFLWRGQAGAAVSILSDANRVLEHRVTTLTADLAAARREIAGLEAKTDVSLALVPVAESMERHERNAQARAEKSLVVLGLIADRLGPEAAHRG